MEAQGSSLITNLIPIALIFGIFYFLIIRPQQKQEKKRQSMLNSLNKGDRIVTTGGIIGTITAIKEQELEIKITENTRITILRTAVMSLYSGANQPPATR